jgi:2-hydroxy-3-oxopropionate reductase
MQVASRIGFFGTGTMGKPMVRSLLRGGFPVAVWNRTPARYAELLAEGASAPGTPRAVAAASDVLIVMLEEAAHVDALLDGPEGVLAGVAPGSIFINMGTNRPRHAQVLAERFKARSVAALDAPVRGGIEAAIAGKLLIMVGGPREAFTRARPVFEAMGSSIVHAGEAPGSGQVAKACYQIVVASTLEAVAEALALAHAFGSTREGVLDVLRKGATASVLVEQQATRIIEGDREGGRRIDDFMKDRANVADALDGTGLTLPLSDAVFDLIKDIVESGNGDRREAELYTLLGGSGVRRDERSYQ